jgi:hypothetical protein
MASVMTETLTNEQSVSDADPYEVAIAIARLERYKSPDSDQIPAEVIQAGGESLQPAIDLTNSVWSNEDVNDQRKESFAVLA